MIEHLGFGIGLRHEHFNEILSSDTTVCDWFEFVPENFMANRGRPFDALMEVSRRYPVISHGVSLSIGSVDPLNQSYLRALKKLKQQSKARWITDHLCWTGAAGKNSHDLLPLPYTDETLEHIIPRIRETQDFLEGLIALENPSSYLEFRHSSYHEADFLRALCLESGCYLLLDINNVYVSSRNHGFDPHDYIDRIPASKVMQYHLAGHSDHGTHLLDTHIGPTPEPVWDLYRYALGRIGPRSTLVEWDEDIPPLAVVLAESEKARHIERQIVAENRKKANPWAEPRNQPLAPGAL